MGYYQRDYYRPSGFGSFSLFPLVLKNLIIINAVVFVLQILLEKVAIGDYPGWFLLNNYFALNPFSGANQYGIEYNFQIWQLVTYQFMHADFMHIGFNMLMLWMFGHEICNEMGERKFLFFYLLSGVGAGLLQLLFTHSGGYTIGASGAVYGVMIAFAMYYPDRYMYIYFLIPVRAKYVVAGLIIMEYLAVSNDGSMIAHMAHIGGAMTGAVFVLLDRRYKFNFNNLFKSKKPFGANNQSGAYRRPYFENDTEVKEAKFYDINSPTKDQVTQDDIDRILDKISKSGYQNLTSEEKRILFEASKRN